MQLFSADAITFSKKLKKPPSKVAQKNSNPLFFITAWAAQTAQTEEFMFQNVAYRPTVYKTGMCTSENMWKRIIYRLLKLGINLITYMVPFLGHIIIIFL